jgi:hypothetical protein
MNPIASTTGILDVAPELSATTGGIRDKEDGTCAECIPSSPGKSRSECSPYQALNTEDGVSGTVEGHGTQLRDGSRVRDRQCAEFATQYSSGAARASEYQASPADSPKSFIRMEGPK